MMRGHARDPIVPHALKKSLHLKKKIDWGNNIGKCVLAGNEEINVMNCIQGTTRAY